MAIFAVTFHGVFPIEAEFFIGFNVTIWTYYQLAKGAIPSPTQDAVTGELLGPEDPGFK